MRRHLGLLALMGWGAICGAQNTGSLIVSVHTAKGDAVAGALVMLGPEDANPLHADTDRSGNARFNDVPAGKHLLTIAARGFDELATDIETSITSENRIDATLNAPRMESITIPGGIETPRAEATTASDLERQKIKK